MQQMGIRSTIRVKRPYFNTFEAAQSDGRVTANLLERDFTAAKANQKWVTDVNIYRATTKKNDVRGQELTSITE
jgi:putative transposase